MAFRMLARLGLNASEFNSGIDQAIDKGEKGSSKLKAAFLGAGAALAAATVAAGAAGVRYAADFDEATTNIRARVSLTDQEFESLKSTALDLGRQTKFSATEAAQGILELVTSGSTAEEALSMIPGVLDLAAASGDGLKETADSVTDIMAQFQLQTSDTTAIVNTLVGAAGSSSASVADLAAGMGNVGAVANAMGLDIDSTAAALAVLAENGIKGSEAGTALRSMMLNATRPTKQVRQAWAALGTTWFDAQGNARPLDDIIKDINVGLADKTPEEANEIMKKLFGSYGITAANALRAAGGIETMQERIAGQRTAAEVAATQMSSFKAVVDAFGSSMETLGIQVMTPFMNNILKPLIIAATNGVNAFANWLAAGGNVRKGLETAKTAAKEFLFGKTIEVQMETALGSLETVPIHMEGFMDKAVDAAKAGADRVLARLTQMGTDVKNALAAKVEGITYPTFDDIATLASELPGVIKDKLSTLKDAVLSQLTAPDSVAFFSGIVAIATALPAQIITQAQAIKDNVVSRLSAPDAIAFFDGIVDKASALPGLVVETLSSFKDTILAQLTAPDSVAFFDGVVTQASALAARVVTALSTLKDTVLAQLSVPDSVALFDGIVNTASALPAQVQQQAKAIKDDMLAQLTVPDTVAFFDGILAAALPLPALVVPHARAIKDDALAQLTAPDNVALFSDIVSKASELPTQATAFVETMQSDVKATLAEVAPEFPFLQSIVDMAATKATNMLDVMTGGVTSVKNLFAHGTDEDTGEGAWPFLKALLVQATALPRAVLSTLRTLVSNVFGLFTGSTGSGDLATDFPFLGNLIGFAGDTVNAMLAEFGNIPARIQQAFDGLVQDFPFLEKMQPAIDLVKDLATAFTNLWSGGGDAGIGVDQLINTEMLGAFGGLVSSIGSVAADIIGTLGGAIKSIWDDGEGGGFKYSIGEAMRVLGELWTNTLSPLITDILLTLGPAITGIWENFFKPALEAITPAISTLLNDIIVPLATYLTVTLGGAISDLWHNFFKPVIEAITPALNSLMNNVLKPLFEMINSILGRVTDLVAGLSVIGQEATGDQQAEIDARWEEGSKGHLAGATIDGTWWADKGSYTRAVLGGSRAYGGPVEAGQLYQVNELGQEFFKPNMSGQVIPIGGEGSGGLTINGLTINANDRTGGRAAGNAFMEVVEQRMRLMQGSGAI